MDTHQPGRIHCLICNTRTRPRTPKLLTATDQDPAHNGPGGILAKLIRYPADLGLSCVCWSLKMEDDTDTRIGGDELKEFVFCAKCTGGLQEINAIMAKLGEFHRKVVQFQQQVSQQIQNQGDPEGWLTEARQRVLNGLTFRIGGSAVTSQTSTETGEEPVLPLPQCLVRITRLEDQTDQSPPFASDLPDISRIKTELTEFRSLRGAYYLDEAAHLDETLNTEPEPDMDDDDEEFILPTPLARSARSKKSFSHRKPALRKILPKTGTSDPTASPGTSEAGQKPAGKSGPRKGKEHCKYPKCNFKYMRASQVRRHVSIHFQSPNGAFLCWICGAFLPSKPEAYEIHAQDHLEEEEARFSCQHCSLTFSKMPRLRKHYKVRHPTERVPERSEFPQAAKKPIRRRGPGGRNKGKNSKGTSASSPERERDPEVEEPEPEGGPKKCPHCFKEFPGTDKRSNQLFQYHIARHTKPYKCTVPGCAAEFSLQPSLRSHCIKMHPELNIPAYQCPHCEYSSCCPGSLTTHVKVKHEAKFAATCPFAGCNFRTPHACRLRPHIELKHEGKKNFLCTECGVAYYSKANLVHHMRVQHTGDKPYGCRHCERKYRTRQAWRRHEQTHRTDRPFSCELCGLRFPTKQNVYAHRLSWHKGGTCRLGEQPTRKGKYNSDQ